MIPLLDLEQGSPEWFQLRIANPGASSFKRIVKSTGEPVAPDTREKYMKELINEHFTQEKTKTFQSKRMGEGVLNETPSLRSYENVTNYDTQRVGIVYKDERRLYHASPDVLIIGERGGFETKDACPTVQIERWEYHKKHNKLPPQMTQQVQGSIFVCEYDWWDWQSFCVTNPPGQIKPILIHCERDDKFISKLEEHLEQFCKDLWNRIGEAKNDTR